MMSAFPHSRLPWIRRYVKTATRMIAQQVTRQAIEATPSRSMKTTRSRAKRCSRIRRRRNETSEKRNSPASRTTLQWMSALGTPSRSSIADIARPSPRDA
jgi:hypothetical protein